MHPDHTLDWLDSTADDRTTQLLPQIKEARLEHRYQQASRLCLNFIQQADEQSQHAELGLVYCQLGEIYRLQGVHYYREAADAFDKARVHLTLAGKPASNRNKGIAYWSQAIVLEQMPGQWNTALRHYQSGLDCIEHELDRTKSSSSLPQSKRAKLLQELGEISKLLSEDYDRLLEQQVLGDPKMVALTRKLAAAEERITAAGQRLKALADQNTDMLAQLQLLVTTMTTAAEKAEEAALVATKATEQAYFAARAAGTASDAADSASRKTTSAANRIESATSRIESKVQEIQAVADSIKTNVQAAGETQPKKQGQG